MVASKTTTTRVCARCGASFTLTSRVGRPPRYCSDSCRRAVNAAQQADARASEQEWEVVWHDRALAFDPNHAAEVTPEDRERAVDDMLLMAEGYQDLPEDELEAPPAPYVRGVYEGDGAWLRPASVDEFGVKHHQPSYGTPRREQFRQAKAASRETRSRVAVALAEFESDCHEAFIEDDPDQWHKSARSRRDDAAFQYVISRNPKEREFGWDLDEGCTPPASPRSSRSSEKP